MDHLMKTQMQCGLIENGLLYLASKGINESAIGDDYPDRCTCRVFGSLTLEGRELRGRVSIIVNILVCYCRR